jgi:formylglycine-generating enzyme required for sulfatase activity
VKAHLSLALILIVSVVSSIQMQGASDDCVQALHEFMAATSEIDAAALGLIDSCGFTTEQLAALHGAANQAVTPEVTPESGDYTFAEFEGIEYALAPAGCFEMGRINPERPNEQPPHEVCFDEPFWFGRTEVTNAQFGSDPDPECDKGFGGTQDEMPRNCVNQAEAQAFCESVGARLPTEAEWEYAARGTDGYLYPWGNDFVEANVNYNAYQQGGQLELVGTRPGNVSWVGAQDMVGSLWEWTASKLTPSYDADAEELTQYVLRGGSWDSLIDRVTNTYRGSSDPVARHNSFGLRCARDYTSSD